MGCPIAHGLHCGYRRKRERILFSVNDDEASCRTQSRHPDGDPPSVSALKAGTVPSSSAQAPSKSSSGQHPPGKPTTGPSGQARSKPKVPLPHQNAAGPDSCDVPRQGSIHDMPSTQQHWDAESRAPSAAQAPGLNGAWPSQGPALEGVVSGGATRPIDRQQQVQGALAGIARLKKAAAGVGNQRVSGLGSPSTSQSATKRCASLNQLQHQLPSLPGQPAAGDQRLVHL